MTLFVQKMDASCYVKMKALIIGRSMDYMMMKRFCFVYKHFCREMYSRTLHVAVRALEAFKKHILPCTGTNKFSMRIWLHLFCKIGDTIIDTKMNNPLFEVEIVSYDHGKTVSKECCRLSIIIAVQVAVSLSHLCNGNILPFVCDLNVCNWL